MKTSNLHEGDWVEWWHSGKQQWIPIKITLEHLITYKNTYNSEAPDTELRPMEITPEFLEYLGYMREETDGLVEWISPNKRVILRNNRMWINSDNTWGIHVDNPDMDTICTAELSWVHQFQHILEHCEVEQKYQIP